MARGFVGRKKAKKYKRFVFVDEQNKKSFTKTSRLYLFKA